MIRAADAADEAAADIRQKSNSIVSDMQGRAAQFTGGAGTAFRNVLTKFAEELNRDVLQRLENLSALTRKSANEMFNQDDIAAAELTAAGNNFGGPLDTGVRSGLS